MAAGDAQEGDAGRQATGRIAPKPEEGQRPGHRRWEVLGPPLVLIDENNGREFLKRWRLLQTPWFSIFVHRMQVPDPGTDLHDHPWGFASLVLRGGYTEVLADSRRADDEQVTRHRPRWSLARVRLDQAHTVVTLDRSPTWTLIVTGRTPRRWGFYVDGVWQDWEREYDYGRRYPWKRWVCVECEGTGWACQPPRCHHPVHVECPWCKGTGGTAPTERDHARYLTGREMRLAAASDEGSG